MSSRGRRTVTREGYKEYIQSPEWRAVRQRYWDSKLPKWCYCCGKDQHPGMHLHHRTYKNLGNERLMDLVPMCQECHDIIHRLYRTDHRWKRKGLWVLTGHLRKQRGGKKRAARETAEIYRAKGLTQKKSKHKTTQDRP